MARGASRTKSSSGEQVGEEFSLGQEGRIRAYSSATLGVSPLGGASLEVSPESLPGEALLERIPRSRRQRFLVRRRGWLVRRALLLADLAGITLAFLVAMLVTASSNPGVSTSEELILLVLSLPVWALLMKLHGLYDRDEAVAEHSTLDEVSGVFHVLTIGAWVFFAFTEISGWLGLPLDRLVVFWLLAICAVPAGRAAARSFSRRSPLYQQRTAIVGTGAVARLLARKILRHPEYGIDLAGFIDAEPVVAGDSLGGVPVLGGPDALDEIVHEHGLERIIIAFTPESHDRTLDAIRAARDLELHVDIVPRLFEVVGASSTVHTLEGLPLVGLPPLRLSPSSRLLKRVFDIVGALVGLVLLAPLMAAIAIAIRIDSPGPVFFRQTRRGSGETTFRIFKFRTMVVEAESMKEGIAHLNVHASCDPRMFKARNDPRVTRVGRFLRRTSLDELPQLFNVLRGEMSLVGPRPLVLDEDKHVERWARKRLQLKPGMTGLWQVLGRSDIPFEEMTVLDYLYVTGWSLKEDLRLILLTIPSLLRSRQAY